MEIEHGYFLIDEQKKRMGVGVGDAAYGEQ
jgi:hypothetical protein